MSQTAQKVSRAMLLFVPFLGDPAEMRILTLKNGDENRFGIPIRDYERPLSEIDIPEETTKIKNIFEERLGLKRSDWSSSAYRLSDFRFGQEGEGSVVAGSLNLDPSKYQGISSHPEVKIINGPDELWRAVQESRNGLAGIVGRRAEGLRLHLTTGKPDSYVQGIIVQAA